MAHGGKRSGAGRKRVKPELPEANKAIATQVLSKIEEDKCWQELLQAKDDRLRFDVIKYLTDKRDGKAVQSINHIHDKPIDLNVTLNLADAIAKGRARAGIK
jgi:hypothetical protein